MPPAMMPSMILRPPEGVLARKLLGKGTDDGGPPRQDLVVRDMVAAARQLGAQLQVLEVRRVEDLSTAFDAAG